MRHPRHPVYNKRHPLYYVWRGVISRCTNPKAPGYEYYGGRGILLCREWHSSLESFAVGVGPRPSPDHELDRIDSNGNYEPGNVRWATKREQQNNCRTTIFLESRGVRRSLSEWAEITGIPRITLYYRFRSGWNADRVITTPLGHR